MEEGQAPTKPRFNINIPLGSGKRAEQEDGLQTDSFFNAKRKKRRSWSGCARHRRTPKRQGSHEGKAGVGTRRTKAAGTAARRADCCRATGAGAVGGKRQLLESAGRTGGRAGITAFLSVFGRPDQSGRTGSRQRLCAGGPGGAAHPEIQYAKRKGATGGGFCRLGPPVSPA